jgi:L-glyceraldehyde 3-phosphate reductase
MSIFFTHTASTLIPLLKKTMGALDQLVRQGKALYAGISNYSPEKTGRHQKFLRS